MPEAGDKSPNFTLPTTDGDVSVPADAPAVIYFYPKDDTPGCTTEAIDFTQRAGEFKALGLKIIGISPDSIQRHEKFAAKHDLGIILASDEEHSVIEAFGVWVEKSMYGKKFMGVERSTFLIDKNGNIADVWRKVRVKGHVEAVLESARKHFD